MSDTFFSGAPHWTWFIIPYFFVGGLAGGAYFLAALLEWFGRPDDRPVIRTGYRVAAVGAILSGLLLTIDLGRPLRFWHMLFQSANFPAILFQSWSPTSFGARGDRAVARPPVSVRHQGTRRRAARARPFRSVARLGQPRLDRLLGLGIAGGCGGTRDRRTAPPARATASTRERRQAGARRRLPAAARHDARLRRNRPLPRGGGDVG